MNNLDRKQVELSILLVNYNTEKLLPEVLKYLVLACEDIDSETIIVDNASVDNSVELMKSQFPELRLVVNQKNVGFGRANNLAVAETRGRYILLLNTDAFVSKNSLTKTIEYMDTHSRCGILGVKLVGRDGALQPSCRYFPTPWNIFLQRAGLTRFFPKIQLIDDMDWDHASVRKCDWVPGCFYLIRREVIDQVGLFDPRYFLYYEEVDHCLAAKNAGWDVHYYPYTSVIHLGGESAKTDGVLTENGNQLDALQTESEILYFRKNHGVFVLVTHIILASLTDFINLIKGILKKKTFAQCYQHIQHSILFWKLLFRTRGGLYATR